MPRRGLAWTLLEGRAAVLGERQGLPAAVDEQHHVVAVNLGQGRVRSDLLPDRVGPRGLSPDPTRSRSTPRRRWRSPRRAA